ncbi:MAG: hypothetical protein N2662_07280 [Bacteroidales bacterium]|nr:hypothetical protein [Bacteroidales bacterium]
MVKKIRISESFENVHVWGIASAVSELKMVMLINRQLHISLRKSIKIMSKTNIPAEGFITFTYVNENYELPIRYILFLNRTKGFSLFSSQPRFDYIFAIMGSLSSHEIHRTTMLFRSIREVNAFIPLSHESLKNDKDYLMLFD